MFPVEASREAPSFALLGTDGLPYILDDQVGKPIVLVFFKTTCPTCMMAFPYIERLYQAYGQAGVTVWGLSQDPLDDSLAFAHDFGATFPILLDTTWGVSEVYGLDTVPTVFLIDAAGRIAFTSVGLNKDELNQMARLAAEGLGVSPVTVAPLDDGKPAFAPG